MTALKHNQVADFMAKLRQTFPGITTPEIEPLVRLYLAHK